jgi:phosphoketolase
VVLGCAGDVPTLEVLAAASMLREHLPDLKVRVVNVVDLMRLQPSSEHPHGMSDHEFDALFTTSTPVIFAYHGYPTLIHRLTYRRAGHDNFHVRGYKEEGTTTTASLELAHWDDRPEHRELAEFLAGREEIEVAGHRVVHGGDTYTGPVLVDEAVRPASRR